MGSQHSQGSANTDRQLHAVDLLRFAAAMFVLLYHYGSAFPRSASPVATRAFASIPLNDHWLAVTWPGWIGVEIFFVISGFVIAISADGASRRDFIRRRFLRLAPTAWICATMTLCIVSIAHVVPFPDIGMAWVRSMTFWPFGVQIDPVYWTLGIELAFYAAIATTLGQKGRSARIEDVARLIGIVSTVFWIFVAIGSVDPVVPRWAQLLLLQHGCFFALGVTIWAFLDRGVTIARLMAFAVFFMISLLAIGGHAIERCHALGLAVDMTTPQSIFSLAIGVLIASRTLQPALVRLRIDTIAPSLGLMTYPLYLIHQDAGALTIATLQSYHIGSDTSRIVTVGAMLVISFAIVRFLKIYARLIGNIVFAVPACDRIRSGNGRAASRS